MSKIARITLFAALIAITAGVVQAAELFTVTLKNGTSFDTRYRPIDAEWDDSVTMIMTDQGNWIGLPRDEVADVTSSIEASGFGYQLDTATIIVGWSPNTYQEEEEGEGAPVPPGGGQDAPASFSIEQFVDVPVAGEVGEVGEGGGGGIPIEAIY